MLSTGSWGVSCSPPGRWGWVIVHGVVRDGLLSIGLSGVVGYCPQRCEPDY